MKNNIFKKKLKMAGGFLALMLCCTACSTNADFSDSKEGSDTANYSNSNMNASDSSEDSKEADTADNDSKKADTADNTSLYYDGADLQGSVVEFSEEGFTISPVDIMMDEDGGEVAIAAAPGAEAEDDLVTVSYSENVTFEIVTLDAASLSEVSREAADEGNVKKQSNVLIFGEMQDAEHWVAEKVEIVKWNR